MELPKRRDGDGPVEVRRSPLHEELFTISVDQQIISLVSEYNAARLLAMLCVMLGVPVPKDLRKLPM